VSICLYTNFGPLCSSVKHANALVALPITRECDTDGVKKFTHSSSNLPKYLRNDANFKVTVQSFWHLRFVVRLGRFILFCSGLRVCVTDCKTAAKNLGK